MNERLRYLTDKLISERCLKESEYRELIDLRDEECALILQKEAVRLRKENYGTCVYIRGLIEISNICKNDCYYCGIRKSNKSCERYRLSKEEILSCCKDGYALGFCTFVMQGGEDGAFSDELLCESSHILNNGIVAAFGLGGGAALLYDFKLFVYDTYSDIGAAEVHADIIHSKSCLFCNAESA